ncbi:hypothetical protein [Gordonia polyisoprenivorans]|uniref:hypothetical protein n=1 Tax=Gordonia polyisoprenivorans TaxID=84595 RepID=UPI00039E5560|nr:hypothetical protein [Gordonia polyisoprenivorans]
MTDTQRLRERLIISVRLIRRGKYDDVELAQLDELMELYLGWIRRRRAERRACESAFPAITEKGAGSPPNHSGSASLPPGPNVVRARESRSARDQHVTTTTNHVEPQHDSTTERISNPQVSREEHP